MYRKGEYATYKDKEYRCFRNENGKIELISHDSTDLNLGFKKYEDNIFTKEVSLGEVKDIFTIRPFAKYRGELFGSTKLGNGQLVITTPDAEKAMVYGFDRTDKYLYSKNVEWNEVTIIEEKKPFQF